MKFTYTPTTPGHLASGRPLAPGDVVDLTTHERAANVRLIDAGALKRSPSRSSSRKGTE